MEQMDYNLLFRWFVGLGIDYAVWGEGRLGIGPVDQFSPERAQPHHRLGGYATVLEESDLPLEKQKELIKKELIKMLWSLVVTTAPTSSPNCARWL